MLYRNNGNGTFTDVTRQAGVGGRAVEHGLRVWRLRPRRQRGPLRRQLRGVRRADDCEAGRDGGLPLHDGGRLVRSEGAQGRAGRAVSQRRTRRLYGRHARGRHQGPGILRLRRALHRPRRRRLARHLRGERLDAELPVSQQPQRHVLGDRPGLRRRAERRRPRAVRAWASMRRLQPRRPPRPRRHALLARLHDALREQRAGVLHRRELRDGRRRRRRASISAGASASWTSTNNGLLDLFVANGHIYPEVDSTASAPGTASASSCSGTWGTSGFRRSPIRSAEALLLEKSSRGAAFGDYDNDGDIDVLVVNLDDRPTLLRNDTRRRQSLGDDSARRHEEQSRRDWRQGSRDGRRADAEHGDPRAAAATCRQNDRRAHFGLGAADRVEQVQIQWPSGLVEPAADLQADRFYVAREGQGIRLSGPRSASAGAPPSRGR